MRKTFGRRLSLSVLLLFSPGLIIVAQEPVTHGATRDSRVATLGTKPPVLASFGKRPLTFEANFGQTDRQVKFISHGQGYSLFLTPTETVLALATKSTLEERASAQGPTIVRMKWMGGDPRARVTGLDPLAGKSNYLIGDDPLKWRKDVQSYGKVRYENLYPGIDLVFYGNQQQLEYDLVVAPGADPNAIHLGFAGEERLNIDSSGSLVIHAGRQTVVQKAPMVYQEIRGAKRSISCAYVKKGAHEVSFQVGNYDSSKTLYIDPVLAFSTFLGSSSGRYVYAKGVAVDGSGNVYVTGYMNSTAFPGINGRSGTDYDVFVSKTTSAGVLVYSTYVGSASTDDRGYAIAVDSAGNVYVTGETSYPGSGSAFPTVGGFTTQAGSGAILFKLDSTGSIILYSTIMLSGSSALGYGIAVDNSGNAFAGGGGILGKDFPRWPQPSVNPPVSGLIGAGGSYDAFVVKIDTTKTGTASLKYATRFGGASSEYAYAVAIDSGGNAYLTGETSSGSTSREVFVYKFSADGSTASYAVSFGGAGDDYGYGIAVDSANCAYVTGRTASSDFPVIGSALQPTYGGLIDAFVSKVNPEGSALLYSTFLGGSSSDTAYGIAVDSTGNAFVAGETDSSQFPVLNPIYAAKASPNTDAFVSEINPTGTGFVYSSYLGGSGNVSGGDRAFAIALDKTGNAYVVGQTDSLDFPVTAGAIQTTHGSGLFDGFLVKISAPELLCTYTLSPSVYGHSSASAAGALTVSPSLGNCSWTVANNNDWITITSGNIGAGSGTVSYTISANETGSHRKGTISIAGHTVTIRQAKSVFVDDPNNVFVPYIYSIYVEGITQGCGNNQYCPSNNVTRGEMAAFIMRSVYGEDFTYTPTPYFSDVPVGHGFFKYVQKMKDTGITAVTGTYLVDNKVTRQEMAAFIIRAKFGESFAYTDAPYFSDVPATNGFFRYIQKMKDAGITAVTNFYLPTNNVTRAEMAAFLGRAFLGMQ